MVEDWDNHDVVFIGCPVWWHTAPMIISTFAESYDFKGKTVVPFCTYAATYRDVTLQKIVDLTPDAEHLTGEGLTGGRINAQTIQTWIDLVNEEWDNNHSGGIGDAPMSGKVNLWEKGNIPTVTQNANNSDGPDFIPNMEVLKTRL
ncbi:MAG: flavodoxin [Prevotella sp.]